MEQNYMYKWRFFVHCDGWKDGGYYNTHYATSLKEILKTLRSWRKYDGGYYEEHGFNRVEVVSIKKVSVEYFAQDYIC